MTSKSNSSSSSIFAWMRSVGEKLFHFRQVTIQNSKAVYLNLDL